MKRTLTLILVALLLIGTLFVSCSDEASDTAGTDKLVTVSISGTSTSKAMTATLESVVPGYDELVWFYQATKNDNGLYATGQTSGWTPLKEQVNNEYVKGLSDTTIGQFSTGDWIFQFKGVENNSDIGTDNESVIYECTSLEAEVSSTTATGQTYEENDTVYLTIPLTVGSGVDTATVKFGSLTFTLPSSDSFNANAATNYYVTITEGDTVLYTSTDAVSGTTAGQTITFDLSSATLSNNTYISSGSHTYTFTVVLKDDSGDEVATVGGYEYTISINTGVTATVSGAIDSTDTVYYVVVGEITGATQTASVSGVTASTSENTEITSKVTPASVSEGTSTDKSTTVTFAANVLDASTVDTTYSYTLDMKVYGVESASTTFSVTSSGSSAVAGIDLSLTKTTTTGSDSTNTLVTSFGSPVIISTYLAKGLEDVSVVYNGDGDAPSDINYDAVTGLLSFTTTHFSEFYVQASNDALNATTNTAYGKLQDALDAATDDCTIKLLRDISITDTIIDIDKGKSFTLDGNSKTLTATRTDVNNSSKYVISLIDTATGSPVTVDINNLTITATGYQAALLANEDNSGYASNQTDDYRNKINLNNDTFSSEGECVYSNGPCLVTATDCTFNQTGQYKSTNDVYYSAIAIGYYGKVALDSCTINSVNSGIGTFPSGGGIVSVVDTNITADTYAVYCWNDNYNYTGYEYLCTDSIINISSGNIDGKIYIKDSNGNNYSVNYHDPYVYITGGNFTNYEVNTVGDNINFSITGGTFDADPSTYVAGNYTASESGGVWTVQ